MREKDTYILIVSFLENKISGKDRVYFLRWLSNEENKKFFDEVKLTWELSKKAALPLTSDIEQEWRQFKILRDNQKVQAGKVVRLSPGIRRILQVAAVFLAIFGFYCIYYFLIQRPNNELLYTSDNKVKVVNLADGSIVWLNKQTTIRYSSQNKNERNIILEGEAYFEVSKDSTKPFIIRAGSTQTRVLGTAFNLKENPDGLVELTVVEGKVSFSNLKNFELILHAGEQGIALKEKDSLLKKENTDVNILSWKDSTLIFRNQKIEKVIPDIERYFNIKIIYPPELDSLTFTSEFPHPTLDSIIYAFSLSLNLDYKIKNDKIYLNKK